MENCQQYDAIHNFSVWLNSDYNPADINRFRSHAEKILSGKSYKRRLPSFKILENLYEKESHFIS